jgi:sulfite oxidase
MNIFNKLKSTKRLLISTSNISTKTSLRCITTKASSNSNENNYSNISSSIKLVLLASIAATSITNCDDTKNKKIYHMTEISKHKTKDTGVWVTYEDGVYDITKFIVDHPGGQEKIILAAGGPVEPFWRVYQQHYNSKLPIDLLKPMRIGSLHPDDYKALQESNKKDSSDPYSDDPPVSPVLNAYNLKPINAEAPSTLLATPYVTPKDLWFVRNHHPVPVHNREKEKNSDGLCNFNEDYKITISGVGTNGKTTTLSLKDLKKFPKHNITVTTQCGGNRRY